MSRVIAILLGVLLIIVILVVGYRMRNTSSPTASTPLNLELYEIIPEDWQPIQEELIRINIDCDNIDDPMRVDEEEWLLYYMYDSGQIGGVIYDVQNRPRGTESIAIAEQTPAYLFPYRLLPDYHVPKTAGYLGDEQVDYNFAASPNSRAAHCNTNRLQVRGFQRGQVNRYSIFWWTDAESGYDGVHAYTPGWFSLSPSQPHNWTAWDEGTPYITTLWAWEPQTDRSNICRRVKWEFQEGDEVIPQGTFVAFYDGDLLFCDGSTPQDPAFPEGQVLAYLKDGAGSRWLNGVTLEHSTANARVVRITSPVVVDRQVGENPPVDAPVLSEVEVDYDVDETRYSELWSVVMIQPEHIKETIKWRIVDARPRE